MRWEPAWFEVRTVTGPEVDPILQAEIGRAVREATPACRLGADAQTVAMRMHSGGWVRATQSGFRAVSCGSDTARWATDTFLMKMRT